MPDNDWRLMAGPKPQVEPCRICRGNYPREVQTNKRFHAAAAVCNSCLSIVANVHSMRNAMTSTSEH